MIPACSATWVLSCAKSTEASSPFLGFPVFPRLQLTDHFCFPSKVYTFETGGSFRKSWMLCKFGALLFLGRDMMSPRHRVLHGRGLCGC